ncbi:MAG: long-chain fatty acid--CoA ligase, partial [Anaerolineae bacterium]|nr:long-chain fatty acid--CoA ligase [Anaerolineae bacterium]
LYDHPAILECAIIGVPDSYQGESVKAFVVVREGHRLTADDVIDYCRTHLAPFKCPRVVEFRDSLPKSAVGKVLRTALRQQG